MMRKQITPFICVLILFQFQNAEDYFIAKGFEESGGVSRFFDGLSKPQVDSLMFHSSRKISLFAAWISCKRKCIKVQEANLKHVSSPKHEFLGFLSAKLNMPLPTWWREELLELEVVDAIRFPALIRHEDFTVTNEVTHKRWITLSELSDYSITGALRENGFRLSWDRNESMPGTKPEAFAIVNLSDNRKVFAISDHVSNKFNIYCVDENGKELWTSKVFGHLRRRVGGRLGFATGYLEIIVRENDVAIFGVNQMSIFVETFSLESGQVLSRFSTLY